ncbi:hypothetical protein ACFC8N_25870 [Streptomyces sp. NPDC055966]|uniref:hypothetical protein n=1 Tax=Streptomyces sp. NPDC055966 TaxID=3345669 RepID=UPI0035D842EB
MLAIQTFAHGLDFPLSPQEEAVIAAAGPTRRAEFTSVRACAQDALTALGVLPAPRPWPSSAASAPSASTPSPTPRSRREHWASSPAPRSAPPSPGCPRPGSAGTAS